MCGCVSMCVCFVCVYEEKKIGRRAAGEAVVLEAVMPVVGRVMLCKIVCVSERASACVSTS